MLGDARFLRSIRARNLLSFGPDTPALELKSLNVFIGPNGSGKSNMIDSVSILQAAPGNLMSPIQRGGGINEWLWKGGEQTPTAELEVTTANPLSRIPVRHRLSLTMTGQRAELVDESIEDESPSRSGNSDVYFYYRFQRGRPVLNVKSEAGINHSSRRDLRREDLAFDQSVLSQRKDPEQYPEITHLGNEYARIKIFRDWNLGNHTEVRKPQATDLPANFLLEDGANLALILNDLEHRSKLRRSLVEKLKDADGSIEDFSTKVAGGTIQLFLHYAGLTSPIPATRLSDGTIRYLCLLAILCHPSPPPLVCIDEPELGLHPDLLPGLTNLLVEASHRMQLIVTSHSDTLVDALSSTPEAVVVCEKRDASTHMCRKTRAELVTWLEEYGLGQLWRRGELGGNRW